MSLAKLQNTTIVSSELTHARLKYLAAKIGVTEDIVSRLALGVSIREGRIPDNWEPEENILDRRLLRKFNKKKRPVEAVSSQDVDDFTMHSKRRCAKQAAVKARLAARNEHEEDGD